MRFVLFMYLLPRQLLPQAALFSSTSSEILTFMWAIVGEVCHHQWRQVSFLLLVHHCPGLGSRCLEPNSASIDLRVCLFLHALETKGRGIAPASAVSRTRSRKTSRWSSFTCRTELQSMCIDLHVHHQNAGNTKQRQKQLERNSCPLRPSCSFAGAAGQRSPSRVCSLFRLWPHCGYYELSMRILSGYSGESLFRNILLQFFKLRELDEIKLMALRYILGESRSKTLTWKSPCFTVWRLLCSKPPLAVFPELLLIFLVLYSSSKRCIVADTPKTFLASMSTRASSEVSHSTEPSTGHLQKLRNNDLSNTRPQMSTHSLSLKLVQSSWQDVK